MNTRWLSVIAVALLVVIGVLAWVLFAAPAQTPTASAPQDWSVGSTTGDSASTPAQPSDIQVSVSSPVSGATVGHTFTVTGTAPNAWYFEAVFPIKVTTPAGDTLGAAQAQAQTDWTVPGQIPFTATLNITSSYSGPATVALLKDNPSGLPQNDDSVEVSVIIQ